MGGLLGGPKGMLAPPSQIIGGGGAWPPPLPAPMRPTVLGASRVIWILFLSSVISLFFSPSFWEAADID